MDDGAHFAAFSFVDRITHFEPARRARGEFAVPASIAGFPACLVAEAVGQLAAWVAMEAISFRGRPVAALADQTRFHGTVRPGETLALAVEIESCDDDAVAYRGSAHVGERLVIELADCLGPMLPVADFDAPEALAARLELLRGSGAQPGRFRGVEPAPVTPIDGEPGAALLHVPASAPFFADHFPRRPVYPGTLLLDALAGLALDVAREALPAAAGTMSVQAVHDVKIRSFTPPGALLDLSVDLIEAADTSVRLKLGARAKGKAVAQARIEIGTGGTR